MRTACTGGLSTALGWLVVTLAIAAGLPCAAQVKRIYIAADDHTDYLWSADEVTYRQAFLNMLDYYLALADSTASEPPEFQSRWNCDGYFWVWEYEKNKTPAEFQRLIGRIRDGHIGVPLNALAVCLGGTPAEAVLRGMYYPGKLERQYSLSFPLANSIENQTLSLGLASLWAGSGARYSWRGICDCATQLPNPGNRDQEIYWFTGPDGARVLMKWYSLTFGDNRRLGGYAEAFHPAQAVEDATNKIGTAAYPYLAAGAFGHGWDGLASMTTAFVSTAKQTSTATRKVIVSNELDFFQDFEQAYGAQIPSVGLALGNEWELLCASLAEVSAKVKRAVEKLRAAEALATLVSLHDPGFSTGRTASRDLAWVNLGMYWEHVWHANGSVPRIERERFQRRLADEIRAYVNRLQNDAEIALGNLIPNPGSNSRFFVFNALSWPRSDVADLPFPGPGPVHVVDVTTGKEVPSQLVSVNQNALLRILAPDVPPVGYKVFEVRNGVGQNHPGGPTVTGRVVENAEVKVTLADNGAIVSLIDKQRQDREFAARISGKSLNDLGPGTGTVVTENVGPVAATLVASASGPLKHTSRVTLVRGSPRITIENEIEQNFGDVRTWEFVFNLQSPVVWHEEVGAILRAKLARDGGHYHDTLARYDWLTLNHFFDISENEIGVTLSNADCYFMRLGDSTPTSLDTNQPRVSVLAGGQIDSTSYGIQNQGLDTYFLQRFALTTHGKFTAADAMRFSLEHQNPLVAAAVTAGKSVFPEKTFSLLSLNDPNVMLWAIKPADDGIQNGVIARVWNLAGSATTLTMTPPSGLISGARFATHIETPTGPAPTAGGSLAVPLNPWQMATYAIDFSNLFGPAAIRATTSARVGIPLTFRLLSATDAGLPYQAASAIGDTPGIPLDTRRIPLNLDPLLLFSLNTPPVFRHYFGQLDAFGQAQATVSIPADNGLIGFSFYTAFVTLDPSAPSAVRSISNSEKVTIGR
ncbi:MAG: glycoside hydrolase [Planctomycetes bacterium]|nr:glycoside hydrolase [Planctomycetota bacterium]